MSEQAEVGPPRGPDSRFKQVWMMMEVEVVDEMALRTYDLHAQQDQDGNFEGLVQMDDNERVQWALTFVASHAWQAATASTGVKVLGGGVVQVRYVTEDGRHYMPWTLPRWPVRGNDGELLGEFPTGDE